MVFVLNNSNIKIKFVLFGLVSLIFVLLQLVFSPKAHATTYNLTPTPAPGECNIYDAATAINTSSTSGGCAAGTSSNTVNLAAGLYTLIGDIPTITFDGDLTIKGAGASQTIISGAGFQGVYFDPSSGSGEYTLSISDLTLQDFNNLTGLSLISFNGSMIATNLLIHDNICTTEPNCSLFRNNSENNTQNVVIKNSAIYNNSSSALIITFNQSTAINFDLINNTFYGNDGSIMWFVNGAGGTTSTLNFVNNTVSNNNFPSNYGWLGLNILGFDTGTSNVNVKNNIFNNNVSGDTPNNCGANPSTNGNIITQGGNISSDDTCNTFFNGTNDKNSTNPLLGAFSEVNNTWVMPLLANSPALDNGIAGGLTPGTDQRGVSRPQGSAPDSGAYELEVPVAPGLPNTGIDPGLDMKIPAIIASIMVLSGIAVAGYSLRGK